MNDMQMWRRELVNELRTIADPQRLERLWSGATAGEISSYEEEVAHVFDDYDIDGFLSRPEQTGMTDRQLEALRRFRSEIASFVERMNREHGGRPDYRRVLSDPLWQRITSLAKAFVATIES